MDGVSQHAGRRRAQRLYRVLGDCQRCGAAKAYDRHHSDGNTLNNAPENVAQVCRRCHMEEDGRLAAFATQARKRIAETTEAAAAARRARAHCKRGHLLSGANLYLRPNGARECVTCRKRGGRNGA